jgi:hypothetical protein
VTRVTKLEALQIKKNCEVQFQINQTPKDVSGKKKQPHKKI